MKYQFHTILLIFLGFFLILSCKKESSHETNQANFKEGLWKFKVKVEMNNTKIPEIQFESCLKKDEYIPTQKNEKSQCKAIKQSFDGKKAEWEFECNNQGIISKMIGKANYSKETMEGEIKVMFNNQEIVQKISGNYIGECTK